MRPLNAAFDKAGCLGCVPSIDEDLVDDNEHYNNISDVYMYVPLIVKERHK